MKKINIILFLFLYFYIILPNYSHAVESTFKSTATIDELEHSLEDVIKEYKIPGMAIILISRDGIIWDKYFGKADIESGVPVTPDTIFRAGSVSKMFVSASMLMLQERGLIDLNMKLREVAPEIKFENPWEDTDPVRLVHLLEHTTGFDDYHINEYSYSGPPISLKEALEINPSSRKSRWKPGTFMSYCNSGPTIAAYVLEKITGQTYEEFVQENIFNKLGMKTASFSLTGVVEEKLAKGYSSNKMMPGYSKDGAYWNILMWPSGSLNCRATELANFAQMLINRGSYKGQSLLIPESIARMERAKSTLAAKQGMPYGYGLGNYADMHGGFVFQGHTGGLCGYYATVKYMPEYGLGLVIMKNDSNQTSFERILSMLSKYLYKDLNKPNPQRSNLPADDLKAFVGRYEQATSSKQMEHYISRLIGDRVVTLEGNRLFYTPFLGGDKKELIPVSDNRFRFQDESVATSIFLKNDGDLHWLQVAEPNSGNFRKTSSFLKTTELVTYSISFCLMITSLLFALIWIPRKLLGKMKDVKHLSLRGLPLLAVCAFFLFMVVPMSSPNPFQDLGRITFYSISFFSLTILYAVLSFVALSVSIWSFMWQINRVLRIHSLLVSVGSSILTIYLLYWGYIGWRSWT